MKILPIVSIASRYSTGCFWSLQGDGPTYDLWWQAHNIRTACHNGGL